MWIFNNYAAVVAREIFFQDRISKELAEVSLAEIEMKFGHSPLFRVKENLHATVYKNILDNVLPTHWQVVHIFLAI